MKATLLVLAVAGLLSSSAGVAQAILRSGTEVPLRTTSDLHSKTHRQGDRFELLVDQDVAVDGHVVIPKGSKAFGEIAKHSVKGPYGKAGRLELRLLYVTANGRNIRLDGERARKGADNIAPTVAASLVSGVIGAVIFGKNAFIPGGTLINGYVHRDLTVGD